MIEFDRKWFIRALKQLEKSLDAMNDENIEQALYYMARALDDLSSGVYPMNDGWAEGVGEKLDYAVIMLDDARKVLKEKLYAIAPKEGR